MTDSFIDQIDAQIKAVKRANTVDDLLHIVRSTQPSGCENVPEENGAHFYGTGIEEFREGLPESWRYYYIEGSYYWATQDIANNWMTFIEGDIVKGLTDSARDEIMKITGEDPISWTNS